MVSEVYSGVNTLIINTVPILGNWDFPNFQNPKILIKNFGINDIFH